MTANKLAMGLFVHILLRRFVWALIITQDRLAYNAGWQKGVVCRNIFRVSISSCFSIYI